jgi:hypothetical protein
VSQDTAPARPLRRAAKVALAALTLPAVLALAGCDGTNAAAPAAAVALGPASDSTSLHDAICTKVEVAWARFVPQATFVAVQKSHGVSKTSVEINSSDYDRLSIGLFDSLTGNRDFQFAYAVDSVATDASDIYSDLGQRASPKPDLAKLKTDAPVLAKACGMTLEVPAS